MPMASTAIEVRVKAGLAASVRMPAIVPGL
jgi:hypothetical protein